jgi:hypothetical protein
VFRSSPVGILLVMLTLLYSSSCHLWHGGRTPVTYTGIGAEVTEQEGVFQKL